MKLDLTFTKPGYIASPYWPEMYRLIEIQKTSGMNRARSEKKRRECLETTLTEMGMTLADYEKLSRLAHRPFHRNGGGDDGEIIIPADRILSCMVNASDRAPSKLRIESIRSALVATDFRTGKTEPDGVWERFAVVNSGTSAKLSNQRGFRSDSYIEDFTATGEIDVDPGMVKPDSVLALMAYAGKYVGIGASRKMGWGRFTIGEAA